MSDIRPRLFVTDRIAALVIRLSSRIVPRDRRAQWLEEWNAEIWHHTQPQKSSSNTKSPAGLLACCAGAPLHAAWIWAEEWSFDMIVQDLKWAVRSLLKRPAFSLLAIAILAIGIGGNTTVFSAVNSVLLNPLPIPNQDRLMWTWGREYQGALVASVSPQDYLDYRDGTSDAFEQFAAIGSFRNSMVYLDGDEPLELNAASVTHNLLAALGYTPVTGRGFTSEEDQVEQPEVVMLAHRVWVELFSEDPDVVGTAIRLDGQPYTVIGVLPAKLDLTLGGDLWMPLPFRAANFASRQFHFLRPYALLRDGVTIDAAQGSLDLVSARLEAEYPETNDGWYARIVPFKDVFVGPTRPALLVLLAGVAMVLLIACANVATLLLSRASARRGEVAIRASLGASHRRILRQLLTESVLMASLAGAAGLGLAWVGVRAIRQFNPGGLPRIEELSMDTTVLLFTVGLSILVGVVFGLAPALSLSKTGLVPKISGGSSGKSINGGRKLQNGLVVGEVAVSLILLIGSVMLIQSLNRIQQVDTGFDANDVVRVDVRLNGEGESDGAKLAQSDRMISNLSALPGVLAIGGIDNPPLSGNGGDTYVWDPENPPEPIQNIQNTAQELVATEGFFEAMGVKLLQGRTFQRTDNDGTPYVVVINERLANRLWPDGDAVGRQMRAAFNGTTTFEVIGVVSDVLHFGPGVPNYDQFYAAYRQFPRGSLSMVIRAPDAVSQVAASVREAIWSVDPDQPLPLVTTMEELQGQIFAPRRFQTSLLSGFAILAVVLAALGLYGVLSYSVVQRRREIGLRMALGARQRDVTGEVFSGAIWLIAGGLIIGGVGALLATRALSSLLFQVAPTEPTAFLWSGLLLAGTAVVASYVPALRASRVDPIVALKVE